MAKGKIKGRQPEQGSVVKANEPADYENQPIVFSLERLQTGHYCLSNLDLQNMAMFADAIFKRRQLTWHTLIQCNRHQLGSEKIALSAIRAQIPKFITEEVGHLLALRYHDMRPMVGFRQRNIFFVLWFDHDFSLYDHG